MNRQKRTPITLKKAVGHFKTITGHKLLVAQGCFRVGLYRQGLLHDLSKYHPVEFLVGARYYQGNCSPNNAERDETGCSEAWMHHKGRNRHHYEYWYDYPEHPGDINPDLNPSRTVPVKMPGRYVVEMLMDRIAASKIYRKQDYTDQDPIAYYLRGNTRKMMHPETADLLEKLLNMLAEKGEEETFAYVRRHLIKGHFVSGKKVGHTVR